MSSQSKVTSRFMGNLMGEVLDLCFKYAHGELEDDFPTIDLFIEYLDSAYSKELFETYGLSTEIICHPMFKQIVEASKEKNPWDATLLYRFFERGVTTNDWAFSDEMNRERSIDFDDSPDELLLGRKKIVSAIGRLIQAPGNLNDLGKDDAFSVLVKLACIEYWALRNPNAPYEVLAKKVDLPWDQQTDQLVRIAKAAAREAENEAGEVDNGRGKTQHWTDALKDYLKRENIYFNPGQLSSWLHDARKFAGKSRGNIPTALEM